MKYIIIIILCIYIRKMFDFFGFKYSLFSEQFELLIEMADLTCEFCNQTFETWVEKTMHQLQMHPLSSWYEEMDQVPPSSADQLITEMLNVDSENLESTFNMDLLTPEFEEGENSTQNMLNHILELDEVEFLSNLPPMVEEGTHTVEKGATQKRKSSSDDCTIPQKCQKISVIMPNTDVLRTSVIVQNPNVPQPQAAQLDHEPQIGTGNDAGSQLEPEKEKNPQIGTGNDAGSQLEPEKEKNRQMGTGNDAGSQPEGRPEEEFADKTAFNGKLFVRRYKHRGSHDILVAGKKYEQRIKNKLED